MIKKILLIFIVMIALGVLLLVILFANREEEEPIELPTIDDVVDQLLTDRAARISEEGAIEFGSEDVINVLVLGLDARKDNLEPHCDAIHMFSLNIVDWTMKITSVPRGTYSYIPPGTYASTEYYLANACSFAGLDYGVEQIERVTGMKADYVVTAGFSQVIGILRVFDLPTTEGLQWLRHRQSYAIGDPQRSRNQAVFMKDLILNHLDKFRTRYRIPMQYILFSFVDTDMDLKMARTLLDGYLSSRIDERPEDITLEMRPFYATVDYHFDEENAEEQMTKLIEWLEPYLSKDDLSGATLESIQEDLVNYLDTRLESGEPIDDILDKQLWLQIDDHDTREWLHFQFFKMSIKGLNHEDSVNAISDFILEKEMFEEAESVERGRELLQEFL